MVVGAFWQNLLRSASELPVGMAKPVKAKFARATITDVLKARMVPEVSDPTKLGMDTQRRPEETS